MRVVVLFLVALFVAAPAVAQEQGDRVRVELTDGTEICAIVIDSEPERLLLRTEFGELAIKRTQISLLEIGTEDWFKPYRIALDRGGRTASEATRYRRTYLHLDIYRDYAEGRLQITDSRSRWIGPPSLGYGDRLLGKYNRKSFKVMVAGMPYRSLTIEEMVTISGDHRLRARFDSEQQIALRNAGAGLAMAVGATLSIVLGTALNYACSPQGFGVGGQPCGAPMLSLSVPLYIVGAIFLHKGVKRLTDLQGTNLAAIMTRREGWALMQSHNGRLRQELGLPDDERLDAP
ncbi:MAG: hypothetical protein GY898_13530 [Proteobacteria bacterium]|nr:hypothetical protein [Pseudomonadota bacterium]